MADDKPSRALKAARSAFAKFLERNEGSEITEIDFQGKKHRAVMRPWGDESVAIVLPDDYKELSSALNNLKLPNRFTAIYHYDSKNLEVIWTSFKLDEDQQKIIGRAFELRLSGKKYKCSFKESSNRLLEIAKTTIPLKMSETEFRNLRSFNTYVNKVLVRGETDPSIDKPVSFWIGKFPWDEDQIIKLILKVNFYLKQYDYSSPTIVVHPPKDELSVNPRTRFLWDDFPKVINGSDLNENLISLWSAAFSAPTETEKFLNFNRIVEYVSYFHVEHDTLQKLKKELISPHLLNNLSRSMDTVIGIVQEYKAHKTSERILGVLRAAIDPKILWCEVCVNPDFFTKTTEFDGGLSLAKIANNATNKDDIPATLIENFASRITDIRNALAHGKDQKTGKSILPTLHNFKLLQPWVHLISAAAGQVVIYESLN